MTSAPSVISFQCMACGTTLSVPVQMAGVTGPCPMCGVTITSPQAPVGQQAVILTPVQIPVQIAPPSYSAPMESNAALPQQYGTSAPAPATHASVLPPKRSAGALPKIHDPALQNAPAFPPAMVAAPAAMPQMPPAFGNMAGFGDGGADLVKGAWPPGGADHAVLNSLLNSSQEIAGANAAGGKFAASPVVPAPAVLATTAPMKRVPRNSKPSGSGRKSGPMLVTLLMSCLAVTGAGWFFKDQLTSKYRELSFRYFQHGVDVETKSVAAPLVAPAKPPVESKQVVVENAAPVKKTVPSTAAVPSPVAPVKFDPTASAPKAQVVDDAPGGPKVAHAPPKAEITDPKIGRDVSKGKAVETKVPSPPQEVILPAFPSGVEKQNTKSGAAPAKSLMEVAANGPSEPTEINVKATPNTQPAVDALKKFFMARTWPERIKHVQMADLVKAIMEEYYKTSPDGPIGVNSIELIPHDAHGLSGPKHEVFQVSGPGLKEPLPIMIEETPDGWKVDWLTFTEFKDSLLLRFTESFQENAARFHVMIHRAHYFDSDVPHLESKMCFELQPPMPGITVHAFAEKGTPLADALDRRLGWDVSNAAVIAELRWRKQDNYQWIELVGVPQFSWRNTAEPLASMIPAAEEPTVQVSQKKKK